MVNHDQILKFPTKPRLRTLTPDYPAQSHLTYDVQKTLHVLGVKPKKSLETLVDLGLSDDEIARYFRIDEDHVSKLRQIWSI